MQNLNVITGYGSGLFSYFISDMKQAFGENTATIVLVPEHFTLGMECALIDAFDMEGLINIDIMSPTGIKRWIKKNAGHSGRTVLDDLGVNMAMSMSITHEEKNFKHFYGSSQKPGFVNKAKRLINTLKTNGINEHEFEKFLRDMDPMDSMFNKMNDVLTIWSEYERIIEGHFLHDEDEMNDLLERLNERQLFKDMLFFVYGFDRLNEKTIRTILISAKSAKGVYVYLMGDNSSDNDIFITMYDSLMLLRSKADLENVNVSYISVPKSYDMATPVLKHLGRELFSQNPRKFSGSSEGIHVYSGLTPYHEVVQAAYHIVNLYESGIPYEKIAVLLCDEQSYEGLVSYVFNSYGIPFFYNRKLIASTHSLLRMMLLALRSIKNHYEKNTLIDLIKTGYTNITQDECYILQNYAEAYGIDHGKWTHCFTYGPDAQMVESIRKKLIDPLITLHAAIETSLSTDESIQAIYSYIIYNDASIKVSMEVNELVSNGMFSEASQSSQVWDTLISLIIQVLDLLSTQKLPGAYAARWMEAALIAAEINALPSETGTVMVGKAGHLIMPDTQVAFILGLNDGVMTDTNDYLLNDDELHIMNGKVGRSIFPSSEERGMQEKYGLYKSITMPTDMLFMSYSDKMSSGENLFRHPIIGTIINAIFPNILIENINMDLTAFEPISPVPALEMLMSKIHDKSITDDWRAVYFCLAEQNIYSGLLHSMFPDSCEYRLSNKLPHQKAFNLFETGKTSVSKLEKYANCPYSHFIHYGLSPVEEREYVFTTIDKGNFYHAALMEYIKFAMTQKGWPDFSSKETDAFMDKAIKDIVALWENGPLYKNKRGQKTADEAIDVIKRAAWLITEHAKNGEFSTIGTEVRFSDHEILTVKLPDIPKRIYVALNGSIDRVDRYIDGQEEYIRIVDYKSSAMKMDLAKIKGGLQLQLLLYFTAILNKHRGATPAGAYYFHITNPMITAFNDDRLLSDNVYADSCHLTGITLEDANVIMAMQNKMSPERSSIKNLYTKDNQLRNNAKTLSRDQWKKLLDYVTKTAKEHTQSIYSGNIEAYPSQCSDILACKYCTFQSLCLTDTTDEPSRINLFPPVSYEEFENFIDDFMES